MKSKVRTLSIETSCDETAASVVELVDGSLRILSNVISSHIDLFKLYGGVVPELASREHLSRLPLVVDEALVRASLSLNDLNFISVTTGPGLKGCLLIGKDYAQGLSLSAGIETVGVHHIEGHILSIFLEHTISFPFLSLDAAADEYAQAVLAIEFQASYFSDIIVPNAIGLDSFNRLTGEESIASKLYNLHLSPEEIRDVYFYSLRFDTESIESTTGEKLQYNFGSVSQHIAAREILIPLQERMMMEKFLARSRIEGFIANEVVSTHAFSFFDRISGYDSKSVSAALESVSRMLKEGCEMPRKEVQNLTSIIHNRFHYASFLVQVTNNSQAFSQEVNLYNEIKHIQERLGNDIKLDENEINLLQALQKLPSDTLLLSPFYSQRYPFLDLGLTHPRAPLKAEDVRKSFEGQPVAWLESITRSEVPVSMSLGESMRLPWADGQVDFNHPENFPQFELPENIFARHELLQRTQKQELPLDSNLGIQIVNQLRAYAFNELGMEQAWSSNWDKLSPSQMKVVLQTALYAIRRDHWKAAWMDNTFDPVDDHPMLLLEMSSTGSSIIDNECGSSTSFYINHLLCPLLGIENQPNSLHGQIEHLFKSIPDPTTRHQLFRDVGHYGFPVSAFVRGPDLRPITNLLSQLRGRGEKLFEGPNELKKLFDLDPGLQKHMMTIAADCFLLETGLNIVEGTSTFSVLHHEVLGPLNRKIRDLIIDSRTDLLAYKLTLQRWTENAGVGFGRVIASLSDGHLQYLSNSLDELKTIHRNYRAQYQKKGEEALSSEQLIKLAEDTTLQYVAYRVRIEEIIKSIDGFKVEMSKDLKSPDRFRRYSPLAHFSSEEIKAGILNAFANRFGGNITVSHEGDNSIELNIGDQ